MCMNHFCLTKSRKNELIIKCQIFHSIQIWIWIWIFKLFKKIGKFKASAWIYRSGMVDSNMVNSKFHFIRSFCEMFSYNFPIMSCKMHGLFVFPLILKEILADK